MIHKSITRNHDPVAICRKQQEDDEHIYKLDDTFDSISVLTEEDVITFENIWTVMIRCKRNVFWKDSTKRFYLYSIREITRLINSLNDGTYQPRPVVCFKVYRPKVRDIVSISFRDRVYQRTLNDFIIYQLMTKSLIFDNAACQLGKGTDFARKRLKHHLRKQFFKNGTNDFYILKIDIAGYYPNMRHDLVEDMFRKALPEWCYRRVKDILDEQYPGELGYNPGSQLIQIAGISFLNPLDHFIKEKLRIKGYVRYMDDLMIIHENYDYILYSKQQIEKELAKIGFMFNQRKTNIYNMKNSSVKFLGFDFSLSKTGKVYLLVDPKNIKNAKRRFKRMVRKSKQGYLDRYYVDESFSCYLVHVSKGSSKKLPEHLLCWYNDLWN